MASDEWRPTRFRRFIESYDTSMATALVRTDAGDAYLKAMGNPMGPHALACELVGTQLAQWFGLPVADFAIMPVDPEDEIPFSRGGFAAPGPAFVSRRLTDPEQWGGGTNSLRAIENPDDITRLVIFDTWTLNADRFPPEGVDRDAHRDNVVLAGEGAAPGKRRLFAIDHSHCFAGGRDLSPRLATIDQIRDERVYGVFPEFRPLLRMDVADGAAARLDGVTSAIIAPLIARIPSEWEVSDNARQALADLICRRARFLAENIVSMLEPHIHNDELFEKGEGKR